MSDVPVPAAAEQPPAAPAAPAAPAEAAPAAADANVSLCPITPDFLAPNMRKHVDPKAPVPLRMMAAKGLVPLSPADLAAALFMLMYDPDEGVRDTAAKSAAGFADRVAGSAFRDEKVPPPVLSWFLEIFYQRDAYAEMLILNNKTPDDAVASIASRCTKRTAEIIAQNQIRVLRHDNIIRELANNPEAQGALIDGVCDFAVRNGMVLNDVAHMQQARVRLFGPEAAATPAVPEGPSAAQVLQEFAVTDPGVAAADAALAGQPAQAVAAVAAKATAEAPLEEKKKLNLVQQIMKMTVSEKIKLAARGNKEVRGLLIRDSNKLVSTAVIRSPRITDKEVLAQAMNKIANEEVLRIIYNSGEWMRQYPIKMACVKNPKVPLQVSLKLLNSLNEADLKSLAKDRNISSTIAQQAKRMLDKNNKPKE